MLPSRYYCLNLIYLNTFRRSRNNFILQSAYSLNQRLDVFIYFIVPPVLFYFSKNFNRKHLLMNKVAVLHAVTLFSLSSNSSDVTSPQSTVICPLFLETFSWKYCSTVFTATVERCVYSKVSRDKFERK
jgi:hypothetical protein